MNKISILKVIGTVAVINILARLLGFLRELIIGYQFGTSEIADMIITVYTVPNFLYIVVGGAITTAFISIYMSTDEKKDIFLRDSLKFIIIVGLGLTLIVLGLLWGLKGILFESYLENHESLLNGLLIWMIPSTFFLIISTWMNGVLNSRQKFGISTFSSLLFNLIFLVLAVGLSYVVGAVAYGVGALAASVFMIFYLNRYISLSSLLLPLSRFKASIEIKRMIWLALPIILGGATIQFYFIIHRYFSLQLDEGFVSAVNYASKLTQFPQALLMTIVTTVLYPLIAIGVKNGDKLLIHSLYFRGLRILGLLLVPAGIFLWLYGTEIVEVVYEHGNFTAQDSLMTAPLLKIFGLSLFFISANMYMTRFFYAHEISITPVLISIISVFGINVFIIQFFIGDYGAAAIAWATVISSAGQFLLLLLFSRKMLGMQLRKMSWLLKDVVLYSMVFGFLFGTKIIAAEAGAWVMVIIGVIVLVTVLLIGAKLLKIPLKELIAK